MVFRSARREGYLWQDPAEGVKSVKGAATIKRRPFTIDELRRVLDVAGPEWQSLIKFGLYTGQRLSDLATLTWAQIDLERDEIALTTRKTDKRLLVPIAAPLREHLLSLAGADNPRDASPPARFRTRARWPGRNAQQSIRRLARRRRLARTAEDGRKANAQEWT